MAKPKAGDQTTRDAPFLVMRGVFAPSSVDAEARTAEVIWTTGARVKRGWWEPYWEELSLDPAHVRMDRLNNGAPLLAAHNAGELDAVIGVVEAASLQKKKGVATVRFAKADASPEAERAWQMVRDGILQNISVGYRVHKLEQIEDGRARDDKTPVLLATDWEPYELSVVPMGADDGAGFRSMESRTPNPCVIVTRQEKTMDETKPAAPAAQTQDPVAEAARAAAAARIEDARLTAAEQERIAQRAAAEERVRVSEIRSVVCRFIEGKRGEDLADKYIKDNVSVEVARKAVLDVLAGESDGMGFDSHLRFEAGDDKRDKLVRGGVAALLLRSGHADMVRQASKLERFEAQFKDVSFDPGEFRGISLSDLARESMERRGEKTRGLRGDDLVKAALASRSYSGQNTSSDFAVLLETAARKVYLGAYATEPVTFRRWCGIKSLQDFRAHSFYRPGSLGTLDDVPEGGEIKFKNIPDGEKASLTPSTKGNMVGLSRKAIVNDDLGRFMGLAAEFGGAAARTIEKAVFALLDANAGMGPTVGAATLFHATHANVGAAGVVSVDIIGEAMALMSAQKDPASNETLNLGQPGTLVWLGPVAPALKVRQINNSSSDPTNYKNANVANPVAGVFRDIVGTGHFAANATRGYIFADPSRTPTFAVGFLDGQESPAVTAVDAGSYDGALWRITLDFAVGAFDYRTATTYAGA